MSDSALVVGDGGASPIFGVAERGHGVRKCPFEVQHEHSWAGHRHGVFVPLIARGLGNQTQGQEWQPLHFGLFTDKYA